TKVEPCRVTSHFFSSPPPVEWTGVFARGRAGGLKAGDILTPVTGRGRIFRNGEAGALTGRAGATGRMRQAAGGEGRWDRCADLMASECCTNEGFRTRLGEANHATGNRQFRCRAIRV